MEDYEKITFWDSVLDRIAVIDDLVTKSLFFKPHTALFDIAVLASITISGIKFA